MAIHFNHVTNTITGVNLLDGLYIGWEPVEYADLTNGGADDLEVYELSHIFEDGYTYLLYGRDLNCSNVYPDRWDAKLRPRYTADGTYPSSLPKSSVTAVASNGFTALWDTYGVAFWARYDTGGQPGSGTYNGNNYQTYIDGIIRINNTMAIDGATTIGGGIFSKASGTYDGLRKAAGRNQRALGDWYLGDTSDTFNQYSLHTMIGTSDGGCSFTSGELFLYRMKDPS